MFLKMNSSRKAAHAFFLLIFVYSTFVLAQFPQPIKDDTLKFDLENEIMVYSLHGQDTLEIVRKTTRIVDSVEIVYEGYYRMWPKVWYNSGNHELNESFFLTMRNGEEVSYPQDANIIDPAGPQYKVIVDDSTIVESDEAKGYMNPQPPYDTVKLRDGGLFYLTPGKNFIIMHHYGTIWDDFPEFITEPRGKNESIRIVDGFLVHAEPEIDGSVTLQATPPRFIENNGSSIGLAFPGETIEYNLSVRNESINDMRFSTIEFSLPDHVNFVNSSATPEDSSSNTVKYWGVPLLHTNEEYSVVLQVVVSDQVPDELTALNSSVFLDAPNDINISNNRDLDTDQLFAMQQETIIDVAITMKSETDSILVAGSDTTRYARSGESVDFVIVVKNLTNAIVQDVTVEKTLDDLFTFQSSDVQPTSILDNVIKWQIANLAPLADQIINSSALLQHQLKKEKELVTTASVIVQDDVNLFNNSIADTIYTVPIPARSDLILDISVPLDSADVNGRQELVTQPGDQFPIQIEIFNNGPDSAKNVVVWFVVPDSIDISNFSLNPDEQRGDTLFWYVDVIPPQESFVINLGALVDPDLDIFPFEIHLIGQVICDTDETPGNSSKDVPVFVISNRADVEVTFKSITDSSIFIQDRPQNVISLGEEYQYAITISNRGPASSKEIKITQFLPQSVEFISANPQPVLVTDDSIVWNSDPFQVDQKGEWNVNVRAGDNAQINDQLISSIRVVTPFDPNDYNNTATDTVIVVSPPALEWDLSANLIATTDTMITVQNFNYPAVVQGKNFIYTARVSNNSKRAAENVELLFLKPDSLNILSAVPSFSRQNGDTLFWNISHIDSAGIFAVQIFAQTLSLYSYFPYPLSAECIVLSEFDTDNSNDRMTQLIYVIQGPAEPIKMTDLSIELTSETSRVENIDGQDWNVVAPGENFSYHINLNNRGTVSGDSVYITQTLPQYTQLIQSSLPPYQSSGQIMRWYFEKVENSTSWEIQVQAANDIPNEINVLISSVELTASNDSVSANNSDTDTVRIERETVNYDISVRLNCIETDTLLFRDGHEVKAAFINNPFFYEIHLQNNGPDEANNIAVYLDLPQGITPLQSIPEFSNGPKPDTLLWVIESLPAQRDTVLTIEAVGQLPEEAATEAVARISAEFDNNSSNNRDVTILWLTLFDFPHTPHYDLNVDYVADTDTVVIIDGISQKAILEANPFTFSIQVQNNGPARAYDFEVSNNISAEIVPTLFSKSPDSQDGNIFSWAVDSLGVGEVWQVNYQAVPGEGFSNYPFRMENSVLVTTLQDTFPENNSKNLVVYALEKKPAQLPDLVVKQKISVEKYQTSGADTLYTVDEGTPYSIRIEAKNLIMSQANNVVVEYEYDPLFSITASEPTPQNHDTELRKFVWNIGAMFANQQVTILVTGALIKDMPVGTNNLSNVATIRAGNENPAKLSNNLSILKMVNITNPDPPFDPQIEAFPEIVTIGDSITVRVRFPVEIVSWDLWIYLPNGQIIKDFGDEFIENTVISPNVWYQIDDLFRHENLVGTGPDDELVFRVIAQGRRGSEGEAQDVVTVKGRGDDLRVPSVYNFEENPLIDIDFSVKGGYVDVDLYDVSGRLITKIANQHYSDGWHTITWNGKTESGLDVGSGVYLVTLRTEKANMWKKIIIVR